MKKYEIVKEHTDFDEIIAKGRYKKVKTLLYIIRKVTTNILVLE